MPSGQRSFVLLARHSGKHYPNPQPTDFRVPDIVKFVVGEPYAHCSKLDPPMSALGQKRTFHWSAPLMVDNFRRRF
jgi:hypothetical protein